MIYKRRKNKKTGTILCLRNQMHKDMPSSIFFLYAFLGCIFVSYTSARDSMTLNSSIGDEHGETLISPGEMFELGFFTPSGNSGNRRYLGIWYYQSNPKTVVWIANRDDPVLDSKGVFSFTEDGNLNVIDGNGKSHWRTDLEVVSSPMLLSLKLMDNGNLVISKDQKDQPETILWQSFDFPTDTFIPGMKMDDNMTLTSWRDYNDPSPGNFTFQLDQEGTDQYVVWKRSIRYWKSGVSGKFITSDDMPYVLSYLLSNFTSNIINNNSVPYITSSLFNNTRLIVTFTGKVQYLKWDSQRVWSSVWAEPRDKCSVYNRCGNFGSCNSNNDVVCKCLPGFEPSSQELWDSGDFSGGCIRKSVLCSKDAISDTFLGLNSMKVGKPDSQFMAKNEDECKTECLDNCQCQAYSYEEAEPTLQESSGPGTCWIWSEDLNNLQDGYEDGRNIYIRLAASDLASTARSCLACGTNLIPYPLSTGSNCGDPMYFSFRCNIPSGVVSFMAPGGTYQVTRIIPESQTFFIRLKPGDSCEAVNRSITPRIRHDFPFQVSSWCNAGGDNTSSIASIEGSDEIEITWKLPPEPICNASSDCNDWPNSSCNETPDGKKRCICNSRFQWDPEHVNCTPERKHGGSSYGKMSSSLVIAITVVIIVLLSAVSFVCVQRRNAISRKENWWNIQRSSAFMLHDSDRHVKSLIDSSRFKEDDTNGIDVPFFDLETILSATDSFSNANKLGQGGFGPVYKGKFPGGQAIAVKRFSSFSGQGFEEFKNEVVLIAKLQHRNLVRLMGYCVEGEEKMLLYEYMPNKSLDSFIFDRNLCVSLDWSTRFKIILGIARGLLYLHQDSRLRIIHRDLKTSNILLDGEMDPKISDFGLARIFGGKEAATNTNRVVGTYGYMSPEYALDGFFSVKSDVFSFGVVVVEVITGKRNTGFYQPEQSLGLLSCMWKLWKEKKAINLMEPTLCKCYNIQEYLRCVNVGLLCVQEDPNDRPVMSDVVFMLASENATLPTPKPPACFLRGCPSSRDSTSSKHETLSHSELTITLENGR